MPKEPAAAAQDAGAWPKLRDGGDCRGLAAHIVNSQAWKTITSNSGRGKAPHNRLLDEPCVQRRMRPNRWASSSKSRTEEGCHFLPPRTGRSPI